MEQKSETIMSRVKREQNNIALEMAKRGVPLVKVPVPNSWMSYTERPDSTEQAGKGRVDNA